MSVQFPECDHPRLVEIVEALRARSKAISYRARGRGWSVTLEFESDGTERLNIDIRCMSDEQTRLSIWDDNLMWFRSCRGTAKNGWDFMLTFSGTTVAIDAAEVVECLISSLGMGKARILAIWQQAQPEVERFEATSERVE